MTHSFSLRASLSLSPCISEIHILSPSFQARKQRKGEKSLLSKQTILRAARSNYLLGVPAGLYAVNNYLKFTMQVRQLYFVSANLIDTNLFVTRRTQTSRVCCLRGLADCTHNFRVSNITRVSNINTVLVHLVQLYFKPATVKMLSNLKVSLSLFYSPSLEGLECGS
jgi:hypothetical protein